MDYKALKEILIPIAEEASRQIGSHSLPAIAEAHWAAVQRVMYPLLTFIAESEKQGEGDMQKLATSLKVEMVRFSELPVRTRESVWQPIVKGFCEEYEKGYSKWEKSANKKDTDIPVARIPVEQINANHFLNVLKRLKQLKEIDEDLTMITRQKEAYLIKKTSALVA